MNWFVSTIDIMDFIFYCWIFAIIIIFAGTSFFFFIEWLLMMLGRPITYWKFLRLAKQFSCSVEQKVLNIPSPARGWDAIDGDFQISYLYIPNRQNLKNVFSASCKEFTNNSMVWDKGDGVFIAVSMSKYVMIACLADSLLIYNGPSYHADRVKTFFKKAGYYKEQKDNH